MPGTMRAVQKTVAGEGLEMREVPLPRLAPDEVLVRVRAASICGTDVHIYKWDKWSRGRMGDQLPQTVGHEVAGEVVEVGPHVTRVRPGDYISAETHIPCHDCIQCLAGQQHICDRLKILGVDRDGAFAEYIAVPDSVCWENDPAIPPEFACVQEPLGNAMYAVMGENHDVAGKSMAIIGDGPIGLFATAIARAAGASPIFLIGMWDHTMEIGRRLGADHLLFVGRDGPDHLQYVRDYTYGVGVDVALEMAGTNDSIASAFRLLRKGGRITAFGVNAESQTLIDYNNGLVFKGAQVHGVNGRMMFDTWLRLRNLLATGRLEIAPVITHLYSLQDYDKGFKELMKLPRVAAKAVLFPDERELAGARDRLAGRNGVSR